MSNIRIDAKNKLILDAILIQYPYRFFAYGSRVKDTSTENSDLDLCVMGMHDYDAYAHLKTVLHDSDLRFKVDLNRWEKMSDVFRDSIKSSLIAYIPDLFLNAQIISLTNTIHENIPTSKGTICAMPHGKHVQDYELPDLSAACVILYIEAQLGIELLITREMLLQAYGDIHIQGIWQHCWIVLMTGSEKHYLASDAAQFLVEQKIKGLALDVSFHNGHAASIDIRKILLSNNILMIENLKYLEKLRSFGYLLVVPFPAQGAMEFPVNVNLISR